jgi:hypothetical protein
LGLFLQCPLDFGLSLNERFVFQMPVSHRRFLNSSRSLSGLPMVTFS